MCEHILATPLGRQRSSTMSTNPPPDRAAVSAANILRPSLDALSAENRAVLEAQLKKVQDSFLSQFKVTRHGGIMQKEAESFVVYMSQVPPQVTAPALSHESIQSMIDTL